MFKKFCSSILAILGKDKFDVVEGVKVLTMTEKAKLKEAGFPDEFIAHIEAELKKPDADEDGEAKPKSKSEAVMSAAIQMVTGQLNEANASIKELRNAATVDKTRIEALEKEKNELAAKIALLSEMPEIDNGTNAGGPATGDVRDLANDKQLCGWAGPLYSLDRPYNQRARAALLAEQGQMVVAAAASSVDYKRLNDDLGEFYRIPWKDRLQSLLHKLPNIEEIFPLQTGYQDLATLVQLWLGEFSQADNSNSEFTKVVKGKFDFEPETLRMYGVMFAHRFSNLKDLERTWIGSLNKEGSQAIKWSFVEYLMGQVAIKLHNERQRRLVSGVRKNPVLDKPGRAMDAADGLYEYIRKRIEGHTDFTPDGGTTGKTVFQIRPFDLPSIDEGNIGEVIYRGTEMIPDHWRATGQIVLYMPSHMVPMYHRYNERMYGQNTDYKGKIMHVKEFPNVEIIPVPNAGEHNRLIWTIKGNIKTYTHVAGEMFRFSFEQRDWSLLVWSQWKESIQAEAVGKKYLSAEEVDGKHQVIWCTAEDIKEDYFREVEAGEQPDVTAHGSVSFPEVDTPTVVTEIKGAVVGKTIYLKALAADAVTIKKSDNFSLLSEAWTPSAGDVLILMKRKDGKFVEIGRTKQVADSYQFPADAATPSLDGASVFVVGINSAATEITDLTDAEEGKTYTIHGAGAAATASTIKNAGKFDLTADITLSNGKFIKLVLAADGKFHEIDRG